jgi:hypothetical protein
VSGAAVHDTTVVEIDGDFARIQTYVSRSFESLKPVEIGGQATVRSDDGDIIVEEFNVEVKTTNRVVARIGASSSTGLVSKHGLGLIVCVACVASFFI